MASNRAWTILIFLSVACPIVISMRTYLANHKQPFAAVPSCPVAQNPVDSFGAIGTTQRWEAKLVRGVI